MPHSRPGQTGQGPGHGQPGDHRPRLHVRRRTNFSHECKKEGIKPILGMEAYMAPGIAAAGPHRAGNARRRRLSPAAAVPESPGISRTCSSSASTAYREGFYYKPRIDKEILREFRGGLIATSACLGGEIPSCLSPAQRQDSAKKIAETYLEIFGPDRFFIEVQKHVTKSRTRVNPELAELAKRLGVRAGGHQRRAFSQQGRPFRPRRALLHQHGEAGQR